MMPRVITRERSLQLASLICILLAWELLSMLVNMGSTYPPPSEVAPIVLDLVLNGEAFSPLAGTLLRTLSGFVIGFVLGIAYGILTHVSRGFGEYSRGLFNVIQYFPSLVIIFIGLIVLGNTYFAVALIVGFAMFAEVGVYMRDSFRNFDPELVTLAKSYKVGLKQRVTHVYVPFLIPPMLATTRIGFTLAWKIAFLCEVFGYPAGLGWEVRRAYTIYNMPLLLAWLSVFIIALLLIEQSIRAAERAVVKW